MEGVNSEPNVSEAHVHRVAIRVPPFWPEKPAVWFAQIEGQFAISGITADATKYNYVISSLEPRYAAEIEDIIIDPPAVGKYDRLKQELIARLSLSQEQQIRRLLEGEELGDRKPSQFLRHLRSLAGAAVSDVVVRSLWTSRLPANVQAILSAQTDSSLDTAAQLADKIIEVIPRSHVASTSTPSSEVTELRSQVEELRLQLAQLQHASRPHSRSRTGRSRSRSRHRPGICWYHNCFGDRAKKCVAPCNFSPGNGDSSR